ncbi:MAG: class I SAM-dependent methyltransferase [Clostridia bacterium]|nr:class I SAM-dependent methyltransferase [Clostridia bacterium]
MKLTKRLKTIADLVPQGYNVADIGTDHGYLPVYLIKNRIAKKVIAVDINEGPLENAKKTIKNYKLEDYIQTRLGSGLSPIEPGEVDIVIIAGMGGLLIRDIFLDNRNVVGTVNKFILQPMVAQDELRKWLSQNDFKITDEKLAKEGSKLYEILVVSKGEMKIQRDIYYEVGPKLIENKDPHIHEFIDGKLRKYTEILRTVENQDTIRAKEKLLECKEKIEELKELRGCL